MVALYGNKDKPIHTIHRFQPIQTISYIYLEFIYLPTYILCRVPS